MRSLQGVGKNNKKVARELTPKSIKELDTLHRQLLQTSFNMVKK